MTDQILQSCLNLFADQRNHPECQPGEMFYTNLPKTPSDQPGTGFQSIEWGTKRMGQVAYMLGGSVWDGGFPVFVQKSELIEAGYTIKENGNE